MKIQVQCPSCAGGFLIDGVAGGGEFDCPACATPIRIPATPEADDTADALPLPLSDESSSDVEHGEAVEEADDVVCPRCQLHFSASRHRATSAAATGRPRVLIVEDLGYFRKIAEEALADDYEVETAGNVRDAQDILAGGGVDLIVLDLSLDATNDGLALLRESMFKPCPVLIYTARDESEMYGEEWDELRRLGADDVLIKGINVAETLQRKVGVLLGRIDAGHPD